MKLARFVGNIVERRALAILIVVLVLIGLAGWSAGSISLVTTQEAFVSSESEAFRGYEAYDAAFGGDAVMILIPGALADLTSSEALAGYARLEEQLSADPRIRSVVSPLTLLRPLAAEAGVDLASFDPAALAAYADEELIAQLTRFFPNGHALVVVRLAGGLTTDEQSEAAVLVQEAAAAGPFAADAIVAGMSRVFGDVKSAIISDLARTGAIAVALMVLILFVAFPARWRLLSLPVVLIGVLWTFGIAAAVGIPLTLVTLAGLPILIGLGVDFAIQFHNRYGEERRRGETRSEAIIAAITHIAPAVGVAVAVTILGFVTLLISAVPAVKDFGVLLAIGAAVLYMAALFVLNAVLYRFERRPRTGPAAGSVRGLLSRDWLHLGAALPSVARWSRRHAIWVVSAAALLAVLGFVADRDLSVQTDIEKLIPSSTPGVVALNRARSVVGASTELPLLVHAPDVTAPAVTEWMTAFQAQAMGAHPELAAVASLTTVLGVQPGTPAPSSQALVAALDELPATIRDGLVTGDKANASIAFTVDPMPIASLNRLIDELMAEADPPAGVTLTPGGTMTLTARTVDTMTENRGLVMIIGIAAVLLGLLVIYRDWRRALIAVIPIALVTGWSSGLMWIAGVDLNPLTAVLGALVIAIGTEFTVLLLSRYWEERSKGTSRSVAMEEAMAKVGRAIAASALTVAAGFGALIASSFPVLRDFGIVVVVDVVFAFIVTVTVVPALVRWLDRERAEN